MKTLSLPSILLTGIFVALGLSAPALGQLQVQSTTQQTLIDFDTDIGFSEFGDSAGDNVFKANIRGEANVRFLMEPASASWTGVSDYGMSSDAWSWGGSELDLGAGLGNPSTFGDLNFNERAFLGTLASCSIYISDIDGLGSGLVYDIGGNLGGDERIRAQPYQDFTLTLRAQNASGQAIHYWSAYLDTWYEDSDFANAVISLLYSTDNINFTPIDSYETEQNRGYFTSKPIGGPFAVTVENGGFLYVRFTNLREPGHGSGARVVIDNLNIAALLAPGTRVSIPEPRTFGLFASLIGFVAVARLRRSR